MSEDVILIKSMLSDPYIGKWVSYQCVGHETHLRYYVIYEYGSSPPDSRAALFQPYTYRVVRFDGSSLSMCGLLSSAVRNNYAVVSAPKLSYSLRCKLKELQNNDKTLIRR